MNIESLKYIQELKRNYSFNEILQHIESLKKIRVLVIGDAIIDRYTFVRPKGRAVKDPILSAEYIKEESYLGGIFAIANHISSYTKKVKIVTLLGDNNHSLSDMIKNKLNKKIKLKYFKKKDSPTTIKKRYVDAYKNNNKLFKVEYINDKPIARDLTREIISYLNKEIPKYDLVVLGDFGHGFLNDHIRRAIERKSRYLCINVQSNSANMGYNYINHYKSPNFITLDEQEIRLPLMKRFEPLDKVMYEFNDRFKYEKFMLTLGKRGSILFDKGKLYKAPILIDTVVDTVGAGDALFAITSLLVYQNIDNDLIPFIANCVGGIKANYVGNKEAVTKKRLLRFIHRIYHPVCEDELERI